MNVQEFLDQQGFSTKVAKKPVTGKDGRVYITPVQVLGKDASGKTRISQSYKAEDGSRVGFSIVLPKGFTGNPFTAAIQGNPDFLRIAGTSDISVREFTDTETGEVSTYKTVMINTEGAAVANAGVAVNEDELVTY